MISYITIGEWIRGFQRRQLWLNTVDTYISRGMTREDAVQAANDIVRYYVAEEKNGGFDGR